MWRRNLFLAGADVGTAAGGEAPALSLSATENIVMATSRKSLADLQQQEAAAQAALAKKKQALAVKQAQLREAEQKALNKRRFLVGKLVLDTSLATLTLDQLQEAFTALARCVQDPARYQAFLWEHREPSAPELEQCSLTSMSGDIRETAQHGSRN
jgi:hypothetical protein